MKNNEAGFSLLRLKFKLLFIKLHELAEKLPPQSYNTLAYICAHLRRVSMHAEENKMRSKNLGIVFGPTLLRGHSNVGL